MTYRSPFGTVPIPTGTVADHVFEHVEGYGDRPAFVDAASGRSVSFAAVSELSRRVAGGLAARGITPGDVVAVSLPNTPEYPLVFHGTLLAGGTVTPLNPLWTADELARALTMTRARAVVTAGPLLEAAGAAAARVGIDTVVTLDGAPGTIPFADLAASDPLPTLPEIDPATHLAALPFSSGTSGLPKSVMLTHRNVVAVLAQVEDVFGYRPGDATVGILPFFHIFGMQALCNLPLRTGTTTYTMARFDLEQFVELVGARSITHLCLVPPIVLALASTPLLEGRDLSSLRAVLSGAAPLDAALQARASERLGVPVVQGYGMTETSLAIAVCPLGRPAPPGAAGQLIANMEAELFDPATGEPAAEEGELCVRGPNVMVGYLDDETATKSTIDDDGWLHTGDIARIDDDGYVFIVDRVKELIKYKGFQVAPAELEGILLTHPAVVDCAVVRMADDEAGEVPKAFVVLREPVEPDALMAWMAERVASYKRIRAVEIVDQIPKSATGKILRRMLTDA